MSTATAAKPQKEPAPPKVLGESPVPVSEITVRAQARKKFDKAALKELADSIRARGVIINPLTLRPNESGRGFVLVCGERRLRAAVSLGMTSVPARVLELSAEQAEVYQADENLHRRDLTALEEARSFHALLRAGKRTVPELASIVKKPESYVTRAVRLLELPPEIVAAIEDDEITPAHGHQLLRVPLGQRAEIYRSWEDAYGKNGNARSLAEHVEATLGCDLGSAQFPKDKAFAGEVACSLCPSNTGNQGALFEGATKGKCLVKKCFDKKTKQALTDEVTHLQKAFPAAMHVVRVGGYVYAGTRLDVGNAQQWVARHVFEKKIPRGKFALVACTATGETWLASPPTDAETKQAQKVEKAQERAVQSPEAQKVEQEKREKVEEAVDRAVARASDKQIGKIYASRWARGWEAKYLREQKVKGLLRQVFAVAVRGQEFGTDELVRALKVKV